MVVRTFKAMRVIKVMHTIMIKAMHTIKVVHMDTMDYDCTIAVSEWTAIT